MSEVVVDRPEPGTARLRLNRPDALNALNMATRRQLAEHTGALADDPEVRCLIFAGSEKAFAAGADLKEMVDLTPVDAIVRASHRLWRTIQDCPKPIVAAVRGYAFGGGCELAMLCDIIVAAEDAQFGQPEIRVGIIPGAGGTQRLTRAVGKFQAMKMVLTGESISGREAFQLGLASEVVADEEVEERALSIARKIARMPPLAVAQAKEVLLAGQDAGLDAALALERKAYQLLYASEDQKEGMRAFLEKRRPEFKGR